MKSHSHTKSMPPLFQSPCFPHPATHFISHPKAIESISTLCLSSPNPAFPNQTISYSPADMYKSKLQQLCQQNYWPSPLYSCLKDGPDHSPAFKASVLANGHSFESALPCKSSKEAQNDAAMRAFFQLGLNSTLQSDSETVEDEPLKPELKNKVADQSSEVLGNVLITNDVQCPYKLQLQTYAQKNHLSLPSYSVTSFGPPQACHFVACVTVGEQEFKGMTNSQTAKEAENAAAKAALTSLSPDGLDQNFPGYVKNLLQELAQKERLSLPIYKTSFSGPAHTQLFYSTVEVGGEIFQGKAARSKKLPEVNAAEVAYRLLEQRRLDRTSLAKPLASPEAKNLNAKNGSELKKANQELSVNINKSALVASDSAKIIKEQLTKYEACEPNPIPKPHTNGQLVAEIAAQVNAIKKTVESGIKNYVSTDSLLTPVELQDKMAELTVADSASSNQTTCQSYLLSNRVRVRVYTTIPDTEFPKGITLIPVADNKWVPVCLEFPNEKSV